METKGEIGLPTLSPTIAIETFSIALIAPSVGARETAGVGTSVGVALGCGVGFKSFPTKKEKNGMARCEQ